MPNIMVGVVALGIFIFIFILEIFFGTEHPFRKAILCIISGILSLVIVNLCSVYTNVHIPVSPLSLFVSALGGIPGVTAMVLMNVI